MNVGDIYINAGGKPMVRKPDIARDRREARRWLVAQVLIREPCADSIICTELSNYLDTKVLAVKSYRRHWVFRGKRYSDVLRYPNSESGTLTQRYYKNGVG